MTIPQLTLLAAFCIQCMKKVGNEQRWQHAACNRQLEPDCAAWQAQEAEDDEPQLTLPAASCTQQQHQVNDAQGQHDSECNWQLEPDWAAWQAEKTENAEAPVDIAGSVLHMTAAPGQ